MLYYRLFIRFSKIFQNIATVSFILVKFSTFTLLYSTLLLRFGIIIIIIIIILILILYFALMKLLKKAENMFFWRIIKAANWRKGRNLGENSKMQQPFSPLVSQITRNCKIG